MRPHECSVLLESPYGQRLYVWLFLKLKHIFCGSTIFCLMMAVREDGYLESTFNELEKLGSEVTRQVVRA